jgi:hypothetical protein
MDTDALHSVIPLAATLGIRVRAAAREEVERERSAPR